MVIIVCGYYQAATYITKQAADMGLDIPFLGSDGWDGVLGTVTDTATVEGAVFLSSFSPQTRQKMLQSLSANMKKPAEQRRISLPQMPMTPYMLLRPLWKAGSIESDALIAAMTQSTVDGLTGDGISFDESGEPDKGAKFIQIKRWRIYGLWK